MPVRRPAHGVIRITTEGTAWIAGFRCSDCGAVATEAARIGLAHVLGFGAAAGVHIFERA
jgi:hypothetical protein